MEIRDFLSRVSGHHDDIIKFQNDDIIAYSFDSASLHLSKKIILPTISRNGFHVHGITPRFIDETFNHDLIITIGDDTGWSNVEYLEYSDGKIILFPEIDPVFSD